MSRSPRYLLETIGHYDRSDTELLSIGYTRDSAGNPLSIGGQEYTYDANNRLDSWVSNADYVYDWVGNRISPPASPNEMVYNAADQLVTWPGQHTYDYLGTGSLYHQYDSTGQVTQKTYTYTAANLLSAVAHAGAGTSSMTWDAAGNRITFTSSTNMGNAHTFVYDVTAGIPAVIEEVKPTGAPGGSGPIYYIREPDGELIARVEGETVQYYHFDQLGSTRLLTSSSGAVTDQYTYDAWGNITAQSGSTEQPYRYVGRLGYYAHYQDVSLPLLQLGVRFYDAAAGRFTQTDPLNDSLSSYSYVDASPLSYVDAWGLSKNPPPDYPPPFHPEDGVKTACTQYDTLAVILAKIAILEMMIASHQAWVDAWPEADETKKHKQDIKDRTAELANCVRLKKLRETGRGPVPRKEPEKAERPDYAQGLKTAGVIVGAAALATAIILAPEVTLPALVVCGARAVH